MTIKLFTSANGTPLLKGGSGIITPKFDKIIIDSPDRTSTLRDTSSKNLNVSLMMSLDLPKTAIYENLKVVVVRTKREDFSSTIALSGDINLRKYHGKKGYDIVYQGLLINLIDSKTIAEIVAKSRNKEFFKVSFELEDTPKNIRNHLSYYATCFFQRNQPNERRKTYNTSPDSQDKNTIQLYDQNTRKGPVSGESIIKSGRLQVNSFIYTVTSPPRMKGAHWTGAVKKNRKGGWFSAKWIQQKGRRRLVRTDPLMKLKRETVRNSKIQDRRITKQVPLLNYNLEPADITPPVIKETDTFNNSLKVPNAHIQAFLTSDMNKNCRGVLFFNHFSFLKQKSNFGKMLNNAPTSTRHKILKNSKINSIQIIRRRRPGHLALNYSRLGGATIRDNSSTSEETEIIVESASSKRNSFVVNAKFYAPTLSIGTPSDVKGAITETSVKYLPQGSRMFMFTDFSIRETEDGVYQYGVRFEIKDGIIVFLNERLNRLKICIEYLNHFQAFTKSQPLKKGSKNAFGYYDKFLAKKRGRLSKNTINRRKIHKLRTELGFSMLDPHITPYPWNVASLYFEDTLRSISDGTYMSHPTNNSTNFAEIRKTATAELNFSNNMGTNRNRASRRGRSKAQSTPIFDFNDSFFGMQSLLNPFVATTESIGLAIRLIENLYQKIESTMGASRRPTGADPFVKRGGAAKDSKISVLTYEELFDDYIDARESKLPAIDYAGFSMKRSRANFVKPNPTTRSFKKFIAPFAKSEAMDFQNLEKELNAGPLAMSAGTWKLVMADQKKMLNKLREKDKFQGKNRTLKTNSSLMSPRLIDSRLKNGPVIERTSYNKNIEKLQQYTDIQNIAIATQAEVTVVGNKADYRNLPARTLGATLGIAVLPSRTPMAVALDLKQSNQAKETNMIPENDILGGKNSVNLKTSPTIGDEYTDDNSLLLEMNKNQEWASPITQEFMNIVASTGVLDKRFNGNLGLRNERFNEDLLARRKKGLKSGINMSPMYRFSEGMKAKVTIFMGYERGSIKKPIWKTPKSWEPIISDLRNNKTSSEAILCRFEKQFDAKGKSLSAAGIEMTQVNKYFLITKNRKPLRAKKTGVKNSHPRRISSSPSHHGDPEMQRSIVVSPR